MKRGKIFPAILYFVFTFLVGFVLALVLPAIYLYDGLLLDTLSNALESGNYSEAIKLAGGYYSDKYVFKGDIDSGGTLLIYETATLTYAEVPSEENQEETTKVANLQKSYVGFLFGTKDSYNVYKLSDNQTIVNVTSNGSIIPYEILDTDEDGNESNDYILTYAKKGLIILEFGIADFPSIEALSFIDCDGNTFYTAQFEAPLNYSTQFYVDITDHIALFNKNAAESSNEEITQQVVQSEQDFLAKSTDYKKSSYETAETIANQKATRTVIIYFVIIYIIADMLFTRFIIRFVKFLLFKVFKIKPREKKRTQETPSFGGDYYCAVTLSVDISDLSDFTNDIIVTYGGEQKQVFTLTAAENYQCYSRVKAGLYEGLTVEGLSDGLYLEGLPEALIAEGYKKNITTKLVKRED